MEVLEQRKHEAILFTFKQVSIKTVDVRSVVPQTFLNKSNWSRLFRLNVYCDKFNHNQQWPTLCGVITTAVNNLEL